MDREWDVKLKPINDLQEMAPNNEMSILDINTIQDLKIKKKLAHERGLYRDLANAIPSGMYRLCVCRKDGILEEKWSNKKDAPYRIEFVNDRFFEILGLDKENFLVNPGIMNDLIFEDDKAGFIKMNVEANLKVIRFVWEGRFHVKGALTWVHFESVPRVLENKDIMWTGTLYDITKLKKTEQELQSFNEELHKVNAEKDKFFSIIAHDLRSPFNSILGFSNILLEKTKQEDLENIKIFARIINNSSQRAVNLLSNLMLWSLTQTGRMNFNPEHFDLGESVDEIIQLCSDIAFQKLITLTNELPKEIPIYGDKAMIDTIIRNLVSNALKFTERGGSIHISAEQRPNDVKVWVIDSGVGISQQVIEKIFRIDSNCSTPDTQGEKGTGLGLVLCKEFIEKHGGTLEIESEMGKGSTFHFTIPHHDLKGS